MFGAAAENTAPPTRSLPTYRRYVHPQAKAMAGVDWTRISASPLARKLATQFDGLGIKKKASAEGMDFVSDIEKVVFSSPGEAGAKEGTMRLSEEAPFVVSMQGHFKIDAIRKSLMARKATRMVQQNAELWLPPKGDTSLAIVNSQVMLLGDRKSIRAALDAYAAQVEPGDSEENPVANRAAELSSQYDIWLVSDASLEGFSNAAPGPQGEMLKGVDQFELGVSLRAGLKADVSLHGRTPEDTSKLGIMLAGLKGLLALSTEQKKDPDLTAMLDKLKIGTADDRVMISVEFSQKELDRGIDSMVAGRTGAKAKSKPEPVAKAPAPAPPPPMVVRIYNAEGGTREFSLAH